MNAQFENAITRYTQTYQKRYNREPGKIHPLGNGWVLVSEARMPVSELELLTRYLQHEITKHNVPRRNTLIRLIKWILR